MKTEEFEKLVDQHTLCKYNDLYNSNAMCGEAGEVANIVKKTVMTEIHPEWVTQKNNPMPSNDALTDKLLDELGDLLFYLTRVACDNGSSLEQLMYLQAGKLASQSKSYNRTFLK